MSKYGVISFRYGSAAPKLLTENLLDFYAWITSEVTGASHSLNANQTEGAYTLTLTLAEFQQSANNAYPKFRDFVEKWIDETEIIVVDLLYEYVQCPARIDVAVALALLQILHANSNNKTIVLLLGKELEVITDFGKLLSALPDNFTRIVALNSAHQGWDISPSFDLEFKKRYKNISPEPIVRLRHKLVAQRGHFRSDSNTCIKVRFDGTNAEEELYELFLDQLSKMQATSSTAILFHSRSSEWLDQPIKAAANDIQLTATRYGETDIATVLRGVVDKVILVVPLFDTGATVERIIGEIRSKGYGDHIVVLAALSTRGDKAEFGIFSQVFGGKEIEVNYLLKVSEIRDRGGCVQCMLGKKQSTDYAYDEIEALHFWQMTKQWRQEPVNERPRIRDSAGYLPDFTNMVIENGAWFAQKFHTLMTKVYQHDFRADPVIVVCPAEEGAKELAFYVGALKGFTIVDIPRADLELLDADPNDLESIKGKQWAERIKRAAPSTRIILLEEFLLSGHTKKLLQGALVALDKKAEFHLAIVDFGAERIRPADEILTLSLYSFPLEL